MSSRSKRILEMALQGASGSFVEFTVNPETGVLTPCETETHNPTEDNSTLNFDVSLPIKSRHVAALESEYSNPDNAVHFSETENHNPDMEGASDSYDFEENGVHISETENYDVMSAQSSNNENSACTDREDSEPSYNPENDVHTCEEEDSDEFIPTVKDNERYESADNILSSKTRKKKKNNFRVERKEK